MISNGHTYVNLTDREALNLGREANDIHEVHTALSLLEKLTTVRTALMEEYESCNTDDDFDTFLSTLHPRNAYSKQGYVFDQRKLHSVISTAFQLPAYELNAKRTGLADDCKLALQNKYWVLSVCSATCNANCGVC